jgi:elongation factor P
LASTTASFRLREARPRIYYILSPMIPANNLKKGMAIKHNGEPHVVLELQHRTPGNLRAFVQTIIRNLRTGKSSDVRFSANEKVELVELDRRQIEFSYSDPHGFHFMDPDTYETITFGKDLIGDKSSFLVENLHVAILYAEGKPVELELPAAVNLKVVEAPEGLRGDSATNVTKTAKLETGLTVQVPLFIQEGETIRVDSRDGSYLGRA